MKRLLLTLACSALLCGAAQAAEPAYRTECDIAYRSEILYPYPSVPRQILKHT